MTSKHYFFKLQKDDFKHKLWMLVLSCLGNFLALPIYFLMVVGDIDYMGYGYADGYRVIRSVTNVFEFFNNNMLGSAGMIAIIGAMIVGFGGFRYLFHRDMVDTYHSLPVKRSSLFLINWLNGFIIWFVPFVLFLLFTLIMGEVSLNSLVNQAKQYGNLEMLEEHMKQFSFSAGRMILTVLIAAVTLMVVFFLVYNFVILIVMFCGNFVNALVMSLTLGTGVVLFNSLITLYEGYYFVTYFSEAHDTLSRCIFLSPLASAVNMLVEMAMQQGVVTGGIWLVILLNLAIAVLLFAGAVAIYKRRPSELAEQGVNSKIITTATRIFVDILGALVGWFLFLFVITDLFGTSSSVAWGIFGVLFVGILLHGFFNILFSMDFKAFFKHKIVLSVCMLAGIVLCFAFRNDWFGYDQYLPKQEQISGISVWYPSASNYYMNYSSSHYDKDSEFEELIIHDTEGAYELLKACAENVNNAYNGPNIDFWDSESCYAMPNPYAESGWIYVKVTLKNGSTYYRNYRIHAEYKEQLARLVKSREYMDAYYKISEDELETYTYVSVERCGELLEPDFSGKKKEAIRKIVEAYNKDVDADPDMILRCDDGILCLIAVAVGPGYDYSSRRNLEVIPGMTNTIRAMKELGLEEYVTPVAADEIEEMRINISDYYYKEDGTPDWEKSIRWVFGDSESVAEGAKKLTLTIAGKPEVDGFKYAKITGQSEIREILPLLSYCYSSEGGNLFRRMQTSEATLVLKNGEVIKTYIGTGALFGRYVINYEEIQEAMK